MAMENTIGDSSPQEIVRRVLQDGGLSPQSFTAGENAGFIMELDDELYAGATAHIMGEDRQFGFCVEFRQKAPESTWGEVTEFITRVNSNLLVGNFEMEYEEGNVRFRSGLAYKGGELLYNLVRNAIMMAKFSAESYGHVLLRVMSGTATAREELAVLEAAEEDELNSYRNVATLPLRKSPIADENSLSPFELIRRALRDEGFFPQEFVPARSIGFVMASPDEFYHGAIAHLLEDNRQFIFYIDFRPKSTEATHREVTEFITRANHGLLIGSFELDYDDGNVRFRSGLSYEDGEFSYNLARNAIAAAKEGAKFYKVALVQVITGLKTAGEALTEGGTEVEGE